MNLILLWINIEEQFRYILKSMTIFENLCVRSLMCLNQAITALKSNEQSKEGTPVRQTRNHCNPYSSSSSSTSKMPPKKKPRIPVSFVEDDYGVYLPNINETISQQSF